LRVNSLGEFEDSIFSNITKYLSDGDLLVVNDTKVMPSFIDGFKMNQRKDLTKISFTFFENLQNGQWKALARPAKKININDLIFFKDKNDQIHKLFAQIINKNEGEVTFDFAEDQDKFLQILLNDARVMLPPYITSKRKIKASDNIDYQTIFSKKDGSIAAPTAGLHFTEELIKEIKKKGINFERITLNINLGTFSPLRNEKVEENSLHSEQCYISEATTKKLNEAKADKKQRIISVGTTALRSLESSFNGNEFIPINSKTNKFIYPGIKINSIDALITNFHLPRSSLFILICALMGTQKMLDAYNYAIKNKYRFYSYGDACLLEKSS
jgi:S-adenosylmethionine:tRNA ribosyltransferase-isomerase